MARFAEREWDWEQECEIASVPNGFTATFVSFDEGTVVLGERFFATQESDLREFVREHFFSKGRSSYCETMLSEGKVQQIGLFGELLEYSP